MSGPRVAPQDMGLPPLHRLLTQDEFHAAQLLSPEALSIPDLFPTLPPPPKQSSAAPAAAPVAPPSTASMLDDLSPMAKDLVRHGVLKAHAVAHALEYPFQHPLDFALGVISAPAHSLGTALGPTEEDVKAYADPNSPQSKLRAMAWASRYGEAPPAPTEAVSGKDRAIAFGQLAAVEAAGALGPIGGGAVAGAAYSPDDPITGAISGAIFGKTVDLGIKAVKAGVSAASGTPEATPTEPPAPGMERTADESALAAQANAEREAGRAAVKADREASRAAVRQDLEASRRAVGGHVQQLKDAWNGMFTNMFQHAPEMDQAKGIIRATTGAMAAQYEQAAFKLDQFRRVINRLPDDAKLNFIDAIETGRFKESPETLGGALTDLDFIDPAFRPLAETIRSTLDNTRDQIRALGTGKLDHFIEDYFPHLWEDPDKATDVFRTIGAKGPLEGPGSFLKERSIPTVKEGIEQGLKPVTTNPIDLSLLKLREMQRYLMAHESLNGLKDAGLVKYVPTGGVVPDDYGQINDKIATVFGPREGAVTLPEGANIAPEDVTVLGRREMGRYWAPKPVAGLLNNYMSPGLPQTVQSWFPGPLGKGLAMTYEGYKGLGNTLNQFQLGLSAFHLGFTSLDATTSRTALGLEYLASGKPLKGLGKLLSAPTAALPGVFQGLVGDASNALFGTDMQVGLGAKIRQAYLNPESASPEMAALANAVKEAGGRVRQDSFYQTGAIDHFLEALHAGEPLKTGRYMLPALVELAAKPIMEHIVPLQKLQVFGELAQKALGELPPDASLAERRASLGRAWDSTDNRMGQLVYDNLFWNKVFKDGAMAATRSVGWNLGTIRELGGGLVDAAGTVKDLVTHPSEAELSHRTAYVAALPMTVAMLGATYQYLRTGEGPQELKDYFFPRTGDLDADGNPDRVQLPSYMKDLFAYAGHPYQTVTHKLSPLLALMNEMLNNEDFYGNEIRNPHDPIVKQIQQEAEYIGKTASPFAWRNFYEQGQRGDRLSTRSESFFGITPAKREDVRTPAENLMHDYMKEKGSGGATPEMVEARQERAAILSGLRGNTGVDLEQAVSHAIERGNITPPQLAKLLKRAGLTPDQERFKALPLEEAMNVFNIAKDREKAKFAEILAKKIERASAGSSP